MNLTQLVVGDGNYTRKETRVLRYNDFTVYAGLFDSGVPYLRVKDPARDMKIAVNRGHQVWHANIHGHPIGMRSTVKEPSNANSDDPAKRGKIYLGDYGAWVVHCGVRRMGCPGPKDDHTLHGELPLMKFGNASIWYGTDKDSRGMIGVTGFSDDPLTSGKGFAYTAKVTTIFKAGDGLVRFQVDAINSADVPLEFMALAHLNFEPVKGGMLVYRPEGNVRLREQDPGHIAQLQQKHPQEFEAYMRLKAYFREHPRAHAHVSEYGRRFPEIVTYVNQPMDMPWTEGGKAVGAAAMQVRPDGYADFVFYEHPMQQMIIWHREATEAEAKEEEFAPTAALGIIPATGKPEGYTQALKDGEVITVPRGGVQSVRYVAGLLTPDQVRNPRELDELLARTMVIKE